MFNQRRGFTLIELLIVIAVILFLAKLVAPRYSGFFAKAQQTEVYFNLSSLYAAQQAYYMSNGRFSTNLRAIDWQPRGYTGNPETTQNAYTYGSAGQEGIHFFTGSGKAPASLLGNTQTDPNKFIFRAAITRGETAECWRLNHLGDITREV